MEKGGSIYILTNQKRTVLYIGVTSNLPVRLKQHKEKYNQDSFTSKYNCNLLVYYEVFHDIEAAIIKEKKLKNWHRKWKENLITEFNPDWKDLASIIEEW